MTLTHFKKLNYKQKKRKGRGNSSGLGGECGRGHKGQKSRSGYSRKSGFEGGQTPLYRRLPKLNGFTNNFKVYYQILNLSDLNFFDSNTDVDLNLLYNTFNLHKSKPIKILSKGTLTKQLRISVHKISHSAKLAVEKLDGSVNLI